MIFLLLQQIKNNRQSKIRVTQELKYRLSMTESQIVIKTVLSPYHSNRESKTAKKDVNYFWLVVYVF